MSIRLIRKGGNTDAGTIVTLPLADPRAAECWLVIH